jgi:hypothetical protein
MDGLSRDPSVLATVMARVVRGGRKRLEADEAPLLSPLLLGVWY